MMSRSTGQRLRAIEHLRQSIGDILCTPIGSRVMRRDYGSLVPALIDQPDNLVTQTRLFAAISSALMRWEPRLRLQQTAIERDADQPGRVTISITGEFIGSFGREAAPLTLSIPLGVALTGTSAAA